MLQSSDSFVKAKSTLMSAFQKLMKNIKECTVMASTSESTGTNSSRSKILLPKLYQIIAQVTNTGATSYLRCVGFRLSN